jgi:hypothetical protein
MAHPGLTSTQLARASPTRGAARATVKAGAAMSATNSALMGTGRDGSVAAN